MPQAIEWSLATPRISARLPARSPACPPAHPPCRLRSSEALVPPKPKLLVITVSSPASSTRAVAISPRPDRGVEGLDVDRGGDEVVPQHQQAVDRLLRAGRALAVAGHRLRRADRRRRALAEDAADRLDLADVADRRRGAVGVDVADAAPCGQRREREAHRALAADAGGRHHVVAVGGGAVAGDLGVDFRAAGAGVLELLEHHHAAAAGDDEAVAVGVEGARGLVGLVVVLRCSSRPWRRRGRRASSRAPRRRRRRRCPACPTGFARRRCRCSGRWSSRRR